MGPFTPDEDSFLLEKVAEWGGRGQGVWASIARLTGRAERALRDRWLTVTTGPVGEVFWNDAQVIYTWS